MEGSQDLYFRLDVPFATDVRLSANFDRLQGVDVLVLYRAVPSPANFDLVLSNQLNQSPEALLAGAAGTYYIQVHGRPENAGLTTAFDLSAAAVAFEVRSISVEPRQQRGTGHDDHCGCRVYAGDRLQSGGERRH